MSLLTYGIFLLQMLSIRRGAEGHGRLMDPPARNCLWRFDLSFPTNYNDNELYCGGHGVQWGKNKGKCGVCGDAYDMKQPRPHEAGGMYATGNVVRRYSVGQEIEVNVELTANHRGTFAMKLCPNNNPKQAVTQECFEKYPLYISKTREDKFLIPRDSANKQTFKYKVQLPPRVTCTHCVLQWTYYTGNMWGRCPNGTEGLGCGNPETFRNCADVSVVTNTGGLPPSVTTGQNIYPFSSNSNGILSAKNPITPFISDQVCVPTEAFRNRPGMPKWCQTNCLKYPPNCPKHKCICPKVCEAIGELRGREGADVYCMNQCIVYPPHCPYDRCRCY